MILHLERLWFMKFCGVVIVIGHGFAVWYDVYGNCKAVLHLEQKKLAF